MTLFYVKYLFNYLLLLLIYYNVSILGLFVIWRRFYKIVKYMDFLSFSLLNLYSFDACWSRSLSMVLLLLNQVHKYTKLKFYYIFIIQYYHHINSELFGSFKHFKQLSLLNPIEHWVLFRFSKLAPNFSFNNRHIA